MVSDVTIGDVPAIVANRFPQLTRARQVGLAITAVLLVLSGLRPSPGVREATSVMPVTVTMLNWLQRLTGRRW
jgi:hypothetical protein